MVARLPLNSAPHSSIESHITSYGLYLVNPFRKAQVIKAFLLHFTFAPIEYIFLVIMPPAAYIPTISVAAIQDPDTKIISTVSRKTPTPTGAEVLVKISHAGVCATDVHIARRDVPYLQGTVSIGGHEGIGTIAALGSEVNAAKWKVGDRVGYYWVYSVCNECELCKTGYDNLCMKRRLSGKDVEGSFAQYTLAPSERLIRLPQAVKNEEAAPILCAGVSVYRAFKISKPARGSWVAIAGAGGGLGHMAIQYANAMGLIPIAIDIGKREICQRVGARYYVDGKESPDVAEEVIKITDGGAHCALICASSSRAYANAVKYLRRAGTMVCVGLPPKSESIPATPADFIARGIKIIGSSSATVQDIEEAMEFLAKGDVKPEINMKKLDEVEEVLADIEAGAVEGRVVIAIA
jgi:propanol-preferring alcohol dehydrogenase